LAIRERIGGLTYVVGFNEPSILDASATQSAERRFRHEGLALVVYIESREMVYAMDV